MSSNNKTTITAESGKQEILITREFDAPRELVFQAYTDPKLIVQWLGPRDLTMIIDKFDIKSGGSYRYIHERKGEKFGFHGVCHEVLVPERIIQTFEFEGLPEKGHVALETTKFTALPNSRTLVATQSLFQSVADRDGMIESGAERGVREGHDRLTELLTSMTPKAHSA
jgi:uncharacterized protein YndB with AHSA1/START domain